ncbi:hypothetical protein ABK040_004761 [Willaertia magna]
MSRSNHSRKGCRNKSKVKWKKLKQGTKKVMTRSIVQKAIKEETYILHGVESLPLRTEVCDRWAWLDMPCFKGR